MEWSFIIQTGMLIIVMAFIAEYFDSTLGMGYGTSLTPILFLLGYEPLQIVPSILLSELLTGLGASLVHNKLGNVELFTFGKNDQKKPNLPFLQNLKTFLPQHLKVALIIAVCSILGTVLAVVIALNIPKYFVKLYIGVLISIMGILILITSKKNFRFSWKKIIGLSLIASFNKGISGGGYGPVVTSGQLLSGVNGKNAIGITSLAESLTCFVGLIIYIILGANIDWSLAPYLIIGGLLSVPLAGWTVKKMKTNYLRIIIGITTLSLGIVTLYKIIFI